MISKKKEALRAKNNIALVVQTVTGAMNVVSGGQMLRDF